MKKYIRVVNNTIAEIIEVVDSSSIEQMYHPDVAKQFQPATADVKVGYVFEDGGWVAPTVTEAPPIPQPPAA